MPLEILKYNHPALRKRATPITEITSDIVTLSQNMLETMYHNNGIGLAGNQVGVLKMIIIIDIGARESAPDPHIFINPSIVQTEGRGEYEEGCLSIPGLHELILRPEKIIIEAQNLKGQALRLEAEGLLARVIQHEIDHLQGVLFIDKLSPIKRHLLKSQLKKIDKEYNLYRD